MCGRDAVVGRSVPQTVRSLSGRLVWSIPRAPGLRGASVGLGLGACRQEVSSLLGEEGEILRGSEHAVPQAPALSG